MDRRVILLNGVPSSGKDTIASYLSNHFNYNHRYIAKYLVDLAIEISGVSRYDWENRYTDRIKNTKELPWDKLNGLSQRQFLRIISEDWIKPVFGLDYFAKKEILSSTKEIEKGHIVISDCGFREELDSYIHYYGEDNITLVRVHSDNKTFKNDSRKYLEAKHSIDIQNNRILWEDERRLHLRSISSKINEFSIKTSK